ncbi:MAG: hypothetical protein QXU47_07255 [Candidatus Bathyarchaeia archaeon]
MNPKVVYSVISELCRKGVFSSNPENVLLEREGYPDIAPCGRSYGRDGLDLSQLEWAANVGHFWFLGPVKAIKIVIDRGLVQGDLRLEAEKMIFITSFNVFNYDDLNLVIKKLKQTGRQFGLKIEFQQNAMMPYQLILIISSEKVLSTDNVNEFLKQIHMLHQSTEGL